MDGYTAIERAQRQMKEITAEDWKFNRFDVQTVRGQHVCKTIRGADAEFIADAPAHMQAIIRLVYELAAQVKKYKAERSVDDNRFGMLTEELKITKMQLDEMRAARDALQVELERRMGARR